MKELHLGNGNSRISLGKMRSFMVEDFISNVSNENFRQGKAYIRDDERIFIFFKEAPKRNSLIPWFSVNDAGELIFADNLSKDIEEYFVVDNIRDISLESIDKNTKEHEDLYNEDEIRSMNASSSKYVPVIKPDDDFLKKVIKKIIIKLNINLNMFNPRFEKNHTFTNMRTSLMGDTKMSTKSFGKWTELLEADYVVYAKPIDNNQTWCVKYNSKYNTIDLIENYDGKAFEKEDK